MALTVVDGELKNRMKHRARRKTKSDRSREDDKEDSNTVDCDAGIEVEVVFFRFEGQKNS